MTPARPAISTALAHLLSHHPAASASNEKVCTFCCQVGHRASHCPRRGWLVDLVGAR